MYVIVPAAGESQRFRKKGILTPKPLIKFSWKDSKKQTMLEHALTGLEDLIIHVGIKQEHEEKFKQKCSDKSLIFHGIAYTTGQASTIYQVAEKLNENEPLLILNSDSMFLYPLKVFIDQAKNFTGAAIVFDGQYNPIYSYVDNYPIFGNAVEKDPISPWALAGAFYFNSAGSFKTAYKKYAENIQKEEYLSEVYSHLPGQKLAVYVPREQWIVWGTAEELMSDEYVNELEF